MPLKTFVETSIRWVYTKAKDLDSTPKTDTTWIRRVQLATGSGAGQADRLWYDERTVNASTNDDIDLVGSLTDDFGDAFSPARIKVLGIRNLSTTQSLTVGNAAANAWAAFLGATGTMVVRPGAEVILTAGPADATAYVCAGGATDTLRVANGAGGAASYEIVVIGASA